jgi:hypothetical protein
VPPYSFPGHYGPANARRTSDELHDTSFPSLSVLAWRQGLALPSVPRHYPSRRSSADRTRQTCLLTARDVQAGLNSASCPHSPLRNVPGRRGAHPGSFFLAAALRSSLIRRPGHARRSSHWHWKTVLAPRGAAAGLNSCAAASLEKCSGRVQHLHPGLTLHVPHTQAGTEILSAGQSQASVTPVALENCTCSLPGVLRPGSTPAPQPPSRRMFQPSHSVRFSPSRRSSSPGAAAAGPGPGRTGTGELFLDPLYLAEPVRTGPY